MYRVSLDPAVQSARCDAGGLGCQLYRQHSDYAAAFWAVVEDGYFARLHHGEFTALNCDFQTPPLPHPSPSCLPSGRAGDTVLRTHPTEAGASSGKRTAIE